MGALLFGDGMGEGGVEYCVDDGDESVSHIVCFPTMMVLFILRSQNVQNVQIANLQR